MYSQITALQASEYRWLHWKANNNAAFPGVEAFGETLKDLHNNAHNIVKSLLHDLGVPDEEVEGVSDEIKDVEKDLEEEEEESVAESTGETEEEVEEEAEPEAKEAGVSVAGANEAVEAATDEEDEDEWPVSVEEESKKSLLCYPWDLK